MLDLAQHGRDGVEQHRLEEEQVAADLVLDARADAAQLVGLPPQRQHLAQLVQQRAPARVADARVVEPVQQRGDVPLVVEHGAPRGLGRVRGQDVLDLQLRGQRRDVDLVALEDLGRLGQRLALHGAGRVVLASPAHALALLGDVRQLQLERAGADDRFHRLVRDAAEVGDEPLGGGGVARPHGGRGPEEPLQAGGEHAARLFLEHLDQGVREKLGVLGKAVRRRGRRGAGNVETRHGGEWTAWRGGRRRVILFGQAVEEPAEHELVVLVASVGAPIGAVATVSGKCSAGSCRSIASTSWLGPSGSRSRATVNDAQP